MLHAVMYSCRMVSIAVLLCLTFVVIELLSVATAKLFFSAGDGFAYLLTSEDSDNGWSSKMERWCSATSSSLLSSLRRIASLLS